MSGDLIDTTEMYLRTIVELLEEGVAPLRARIAERLEQSSPTVSQTVARMERDGLLAVGEDRTITLSAEGLAQATRVMRRHRLAELMLTSVVGLPLEQVHDEACRWEHVISGAVEERLVELLGHPTETPYGTPVPGLDELGESQQVPRFLDGVVRLAERLGAGEVTVRRLSENVQRDDALLARLVGAGVLPGTRAGVREVRGGVELQCEAGRVVVPVEACDDIFVAA